jgi:hypothetical protein
LDATFAALLGAVIGGLLSVLASWLAQRVQAKSQWLSQEIQRRQVLYSEFVEAAARCFSQALQQNQPDAASLSVLYGEIGRMRLYSSDAVIHEAYRIAHKILAAYGDTNRTAEEIRDLLCNDSLDLFTEFGDACRIELNNLRARGAGQLELSKWRHFSGADRPVTH